MNTTTLQNANPTIHQTQPSALSSYPSHYYDEEITDAFNAAEIFDLIRNIKDPEHPLSLEQLNVVQQDHITVDAERQLIRVEFTPTIPHCSMATLIGLSIRVKLYRSLPPRFKVVVRIRDGTHQSQAAVNKQLNDKERVAAAMENRHLLEVVNQCIEHSLVSTFDGR